MSHPVSTVYLTYSSIDYTSLQLPVGINNCRLKLFNNMTIFKKIVVSLDAVLVVQSGLPSSRTFTKKFVTMMNTSWDI